MTPGFDWYEFLLLTTAGLVGVVALVPYVVTLQGPRLRDRESPLRLWGLILLQVGQNTVFIAIAVALGLLLGKQTGLGAPLVEGWLADEQVGHALEAIIAPATIAGISVALLLTILEIAFFKSHVADDLSESLRTPTWQRFLLPIYGGITEEILMRLGVFSVLAWLLGSISHTEQG